MVSISKRINSFKELTHNQSWSLEVTVLTEEVKEVVWACGSDKSPCPDGFTFAFYKKYWDLIKVDVMKFVNEFFATWEIPNWCNSAFITLIPKVDNPMVVTNFMHISLIGVQYKIVVKLLAFCLSKVIGYGVIGE